MFIPSPPALLLSGTSLQPTKQGPVDFFLGPVWIAVHKKSSREMGKKRRRAKERKKEACLVQKPFNNFPWKLKEEIVLGWIAVGGEWSPYEDQMKRVSSPGGLTVGEKNERRGTLCEGGGRLLMSFIYMAQQNRGKTNWNCCKRVTDWEIETLRVSEWKRESEGERAGCLWGHLPNSCFQRFLPTLIFLLCSTLITSIHMWECVRVCVSHGNPWASFCAYCNTDRMKTGHLTFLLFTLTLQCS